MLSSQERRTARVELLRKEKEQIKRGDEIAKTLP